jgi:hypothetical protein
MPVLWVTSVNHSSRVRCTELCGQRLTQEEALAVSYHSLVVVQEVVLTGCSSCLLGDEIVCTENNRHSVLEDRLLGICFRRDEDVSGSSEPNIKLA